MVHRYHFLREWTPHIGLSHCGGRHSGGGGGIAEAPRSVKTIDQSAIHERFM